MDNQEEIRSAVLRALIVIRDEGPRWKSAGICSNLDVVLEEHGHVADGGEDAVDFWLAAHSLNRDVFSRWPKFSGSYDYPVPSAEGGDASAAYNLQEDLWGGAYGDLRRELLDFYIKELSA